MFILNIIVIIRILVKVLLIVHTKYYKIFVYYYKLDFHFRISCVQKVCNMNLCYYWNLLISNQLTVWVGPNIFLGMLNFCWIQRRTIKLRYISGIMYCVRRTLWKRASDSIWEIQAESPNTKGNKNSDPLILCLSLRIGYVNMST